MDLGIKDKLPEFLGWKLTTELAGGFVRLVELDELITPAVGKTWALVGAHKRPHPVGLNSLHKEVGDPQSIKEVSRAFLFGTRIKFEA